MEPGRTYTRALFSVAAAFNFSVSISLLFARPTLFPLLQLDEVEGTTLVFVYFAAALVGAFGYAYACIARDPVNYRAYVSLGVVGKLLAVASMWLPWLSGDLSWRLPAFASADLIFALLFLDYLRRTQPHRAAT